MELIQDIGQKKQGNRNYRFGLFRCQYCNELIEKIYKDGIKANYCSHNCYALNREKRGTKMENSRFKFRAWVDGKMQKTLTIREIGLLGHEISNNTVLMQYTGLEDKNGKDVYEGDVVSYSYWFSNKLHTDYYRIEFLNGSFLLRKGFENIINMDFQEVDYGLEIKVIGNIYEHPELLRED